MARSEVGAALTSTDQPLRRVPLLTAQTTIADHLGDAARRWVDISTTFSCRPGPW
jgi:hypothetical protein